MMLLSTLKSLKCCLIHNANHDPGVLYATTISPSCSQALLEAAMSKFLAIADNGEGKLLYILYYEQEQRAASLDLAFDDEVLEEVEKKWKTMVTDEEAQAMFMKFEERAGITDEDGDNDNDY